MHDEEVFREGDDPRGKESQEEKKWEHRQLDGEAKVLLPIWISLDQLVDAPVEVEAEDGDPGEVTQEDKVEDVAQEAAHVVPCQSARCKIK